jgi:hypothetical protein
MDSMSITEVQDSPWSARVRLRRRRLGAATRSPSQSSSWVMSAWPHACRAGYKPGAKRWLHRLRGCVDSDTGRPDYTDPQGCPRSHPVRLAAISLGVVYSLPAGATPTLSSGSRYSAHADFMNAAKSPESGRPLIVHGGLMDESAPPVQWRSVALIIAFPRFAHARVV